MHAAFIEVPRFAQQIGEALQQSIQHVATNARPSARMSRASLYLASKSYDSEPRCGALFLDHFRGVFTMAS